MTNGQVLERPNVWTLSRSASDGWHPTLVWYAEAIRHLKRLTNTADPRSWIHLSNIHGTDDEPVTWPPGITDRHWNACQHASWYFLPWHRIYLHHFEKIVRTMVAQLGGPTDWTLPFWDYNPRDPQTLSLPPAFLVPTRGGAPNPLFVWQRRLPILQGRGVAADAVETGGWSDEFTSDDPNVPSFGGAQTGWSHTGPGELMGDLEGEPHGTVHMEVGGVDARGLMSRFETAARDPIFWLHHANIDRHWERWRNVTGHENPGDPSWLDAEFEFGSGAFHTKIRVREVRSTTTSPLLYQYEGVPVPTPAPAPQQLESIMGRTPAELVGSTKEPIPLGAIASVTVPVSKPVGPLAWAAEHGLDAIAEPHTYLVLENVTGSSFASGTYAVYVGVSEGEDPASHPDRRAGNLSMFGVAEASLADESHAGSGRKFSFDITRVVSKLQETDSWDPAALRVTLVGRDPAPGSTGAGDVRVGAIKIYQR